MRTQEWASALRCLFSPGSIWNETLSEEELAALAAREPDAKSGPVEFRAIGRYVVNGQTDMGCSCPYCSETSEASREQGWDTVAWAPGSYPWLVHFPELYHRPMMRAEHAFHLSIQRRSRGEAA